MHDERRIKRPIPIMQHPENGDYCVTRTEAIQKITSKLVAAAWAEEQARQRAVEIIKDFEDSKIDQQTLERHIF